MLRLSLWKRSNRYIDEAEFGSNLIEISVVVYPRRGNPQLQLGEERPLINLQN